MGLNKRLIGAGATASGALTPGENFKAVTYTGTGSSQSITGVGFQPDFVWIKQRGGTTWHNLQDSTRGSTKHLYSNATNSEDTTADGVTSFDSDGFTLGGGNGFNGSGQSMVAWCWKANGGTTSSNTDGTITSTVQANTAAGFSIVTWTGNGSAGATVGHGLGVAPDYIILKNRTRAGYGWYVLTSTGATHNMVLNTTDGQATSTAAWNDTQPTSTVFSLGSDTGPNSANYPYVGYCFSNIDGFSKAGTYTGNGSANGPIVETGFEPAFIMIKSTAGGQDWRLYDNKRNASNPRNCYLSANNSNVEECQYDQVDFLSNGFKVIGTDGSLNGNGITITYLAFAADPDTEAPTLASSFNIENYVGSSSAQSITGFGFSPNLIWIKDRDAARNHYLFDTIRGANRFLEVNDTDADAGDSTVLTSFDSDGFSVGANTATNNPSSDIIAWTWKADDNEPTIFGGAAKAVYKFEDNANDVTGTYNGTASNVTYSSSGYFNKAAEFNGSSSYVDVSYDHSNTSFSWSMWVNADSLSNQYPTVIGGMNNSTNTNNGTIWMNSTKIVIHGSTLYGEVAFSFSTSTWYHVGMVYDSVANTVKAIINGQLYTPSSTISNTFPSQNKMRIGGAGASSTAWDGKIDQVRFYKGAISDIGVAELYAETVSQNDDLELGGPPEILISANANAGFSIVKWEGTGTQTQIPHGLSAVPEMIISKRLDSTNNWSVYHKDLSLSHTTYPNWLYLNLNSSEQNSASSANHPYYARPSATVIYQNTGTSESSNVDGGDYISYCFHPVTGYSKFGTYTGNGGTQTISGLGFQPDFCINKSTSASSDWNVTDSLRGNQQALNPNTSAVEGNQSPNGLTFTSDGFTVTDNSGGGSSVNGNGITYIYWAVAKNVPSNTTLANSFKALTYTGNGGTQSITGTGFKPDLVWIKHRNEANDHVLTDSIRGTGLLYANGIDAQNQDSQLTSFDSDGFSLAYNTGQNVKFNKSGGTYVAWAWKAGNTWQSNLDGTIPSTINVNTANGFSIVKWTGNATNSTVGHGLSSTPEFIIMKNTSAAGAWLTWHKDYGGGDKYMYLNSTNAVATQSQFFNSTIPTSTVFSLGIHGDINGNGNDIIAYCFHSVAGYSKIGSYTGNGSANNAITGVGFQPNWLMIKNTTDAGNDWQIYDSARTEGYVLLANSSNAEADNSSNFGQFDSDGFTVQSNNDGNNKSGSTYIYMAIKMN